MQRHSGVVVRSRCCRASNKLTVLGERDTLGFMRNCSLELLCLTLLMMAAVPLRVQTPLSVFQFNASQRAEWARFLEYWHGNG
jgi:hypothetical protein